MEHAILPSSLCWPADKAERRSLALQLPLRLFGELRKALARIPPPDSSAYSAEAHDRFLAALQEHGDALPSPADVAAAWDERPKILLMQSKDVSDETMSMWIEAYNLAWGWEEMPDEPYASHPNPYVMGCADLLTDCCRRISAPIATIDGHQTGRVQMLHLDVTSLLFEGLYIHPEFEFARQYLEPDFLSSIETAWRLAADGATDQSLVFWHITEANGSPIIDIQKSGPSASAATYRAFWHIRRKLSLDEDVYVLASCTAGNGSVQDVGGLSAKISAIRQYREATKQNAPATIVLARNGANRSAHDEATIASAATWAEVDSVATTEELVAVRSCMTNAAIAYLNHLADKLDESPWFRDGQPMRLSDVHIPPYVWKEERRSVSMPDGEGKGSGGEKDWRPSGYDPAAADREAGPRLERTTRQVRVPWEAEVHPAYRTTALVLVGGPGFGKTTTLQWTARQMALKAIAELEAHQHSCDNVPWPVLTDLDSWADTHGQPRESLFAVSFSKVPVPESLPRLQREALPLLMQRRLNAADAQTFLFLDALDQVAETQARRLRERFTALADFAPRLVLSTRESGFRTHSHTMPFPHLTVLQAAALSAEDASALASKWLDDVQASKLEAHLRTHPSLAIVAESPLLLTLACIVQAAQPGQPLPETPSALYSEMMRRLAKGEWRASAPSQAPVENPDALLDSLQPIAWRLYARRPGVNRFDRSTLLDAIMAATGRSPEKAGDLLATLVDLAFLESSGREAGEEHFQFRHTTFIEFLAAKHIASCLNRDGWFPAEVDAWHPVAGWQRVKAGTLLDTQALEPAWEPIIVFTVGLMKESLPLFEILADAKKDDLYRHRLGLLCKCYGSLPTGKEVGVQDVMDRVRPIIERMGRIARKRHPDRWRGWLETVGHLLSFPKVGSRAIEFFQHGYHDHEDRMMGHHELIEVLARVAQNTRSNAGMEALLAICEGRVDHRELGDAATKVVTLAEKLRLPAPIRRLECAMEAADDKPYNQIKLARALLRVSDAHVARNALTMLNGLAENKSIEGWCRSMAVESFVETLDTPLEAEGAAIMVQYLFDPSYHATGRRAELASDIVWAASRFRSQVTLTLQRLILRLVSEDSELVERLGKALVLWDDPTAKTLGIDLLRNRLRQNIDCYPRVEAAETLFEHGGPTERDEAQGALTMLAKAPLEDGRCRILAIKALLKSGYPYAEVKQSLSDFLTAKGLLPGCLVGAAEMARENHDDELFGRFLPRLHFILHWKGGSEPNEFKLQSNETLWSERQDVAKLLYGTNHWERLEQEAFLRLRSHTAEDRKDWFSVNLVCFGAKSSDLLTLTEELLAVGKWDFHPWVPLMRELAHRGWRFQISRRKFVILRRGQEDPRSDAEFGY